MSTQQQEKQKKWKVLWFALLAFMLVGFVITIIGGYAFNWAWTGFSANKLWEWLNLLILPVTLALAANLISMQQNRRGLQEGEAQHQHDLQIAEDNRQEEVLDAYIDQMIQLLLEKNLKASGPGSDIREVARIHTLTALRRLNTTRQRIVLQFLDEAGLIQQANPIINLSGIDLSGIQLSRTNLSINQTVDSEAAIISIQMQVH
jgi:uncharacterized protein YggL (DUF469 family)